MVAKNEIRVGNWYKHLPIWSYRNEDCKEFYFQWEDRDWYAVGECTLSFDNIDDIPLSAEILEKCGFVYNDDKSFLTLNYFNGYLQTDDSVEFGLVLCYAYRERYSVHVCDATHLHELQNIYNSFTKKELNVNL